MPATVVLNSVQSKPQIDVCVELEDGHTVTGGGEKPDDVDPTQSPGVGDENEQ